MFSSTILLAVTALSALTTAQNYSTSGNLSIDLSQIPSANLTQWCASQRNVCPLICGGQAFPNTCDAPDVLDYVCTCTDGSKPNISDYVGTIPTFICEQWRSNCVLSNPIDAAIQQSCLSVTCGSKDARENVPNTTTTTTSSSTSTPTSASGSDQSGSASSSETTPTPTDGAATALFVGQTYGTGILASGLLGIFAFLL